MNRFRPVSRTIVRRGDDQPYLFEGMQSRYYGFDVRVLVGEYFERVVQALFGGHSPSTFHTMHNINICPDLANGGWWREVKGQKTSERLMIRHVQLWRYLMLLSKDPHKRFHYTICRYRTERPLKTYKGDKNAMQEALGQGLKVVLDLPFSILMRVAMLPNNREQVFRQHQTAIEDGENRFYMNTWWQGGRVRELSEQGIAALFKMDLDPLQYVEHWFSCRLEGTRPFIVLRVKEKYPVQAQRELLQQYDDDLGMFIDLENGVYSRATAKVDEIFAGEPEQQELELETVNAVPF